MTMLPNIPRLYTALAEVLAVLLYARHLPRRFFCTNASLFKRCLCTTGACIAIHGCKMP